MNKRDFKNLTGLEIAIIGMAGRFPGAKNIDIFWDNLCKGKESISFFTKEEMLREGANEELLNNPNYVNAGGVLEDCDKFDAGFFKYSPREAEFLNPQDRLFLETAWEAFENAGYDILKYKMPVGVFVGLSINQYRPFGKSDNSWQEHILSDSSFLPTRTSFHFNLTGPSMVIQTACSSSLVAVHVACQSLLSGECAMALAGGASVNELQKTGYLYQKNMILSSDGHCRAFDEKANGTVFGNGLGIVILKRLEDAIKDGDRIDAVIKGSAINNDGNFKTGYTAPSVHGQARAIIEALKVGDISAETISYIETHGTGTILGDPIEVEALTRAFDYFTKKKNFCLIGSLKTNIGHLDNAAGIAGLIKTVLCLKHKKIPPSLHFEKPNSSIDFKNSPFNVNSELTQWSCDCLPRRAGISSLGIGGTNAHVVLEEAPEFLSKKSKRNIRIICFSAKTERSLEELVGVYLDFLINHREIDIDDLAYTLQVGRHHHKYRTVIICSSIGELIEVLSKKTSDNLLTNKHFTRQQKIVFMFPGQGTQYANMGSYFYKIFSVYKNIIDQCANILLSIMELDIRSILYPKKSASSDADSPLLKNTQFTQVLLFVVEYALAKLLMSLNICPDYVIGHSSGEYTAACLSGVFSLEDALYIIYSRGRLMHLQPSGSMLAILAPFDSIKLFLDERISLAAVNTKNSCVVSGPAQEIDSLQKILTTKEISNVLLRTSHAFHSSMMYSMTEEFAKELKKIKLNAPQVQLISNVSGEFVSFGDVSKSDYWVKHIYLPVLFEKGLTTILQEEAEPIFLEVGPGHVLTSSVLNHNHNSPREALHILPDAKTSDLVEKHFNLILGKLWLLGIDVDFVNYHQKEKRVHMSLPTYQFERQSYWVTTTQRVFSSLNNENSSTTPEISQPIIEENDLEYKIAKIWESVFGIDKINNYDNFFELGGNSLIAIQIIARIKQTLNIDLPITSIFTKHSVHELAEFIKNINFNASNYTEGTI